MSSESITGAAIIGNAEIQPGAASFFGFDPSTGAKLTPAFRISDGADVVRAADLAAAAFEPFRQLPYERRADFLEAIAVEIRRLGNLLITRAMLETGLPEGRLKIECDRTCNQLELFAQVVRRGDFLDLRLDTSLPERKPAPRAEFRLRQIPIGPVAVFGSSNFPLAFSVGGGDTAAALAAGCPVIVKGHPAHPGTGELVARAVLRAAVSTGMPNGVFSYLPGEVETGTELAKNAQIRAIAFTGSRRGGLALAELAAARKVPIPVYAEMSSVNPVLMFPAALGHRGDELAKGYVGSLTQGAGQFCTNPGLVFVLEGSGLESFLAAVARELERHAPAVMLTPNIHAAFERGRDALQAHPGVMTAGESLKPEGPNRARAVVFRTDFDTFLCDEALEQEVFGASSLVIVCRNVEELAQAIEHIEGQLTATLHLDDEDIPLARELMPALERKAGRILANDWPTGVEVTDAMVHGGPYPATSNALTTSVGSLSIRRFLRPVSYQSIPTALLPVELRDDQLRHRPHLRNGTAEPNLG